MKGTVARSAGPFAREEILLFSVLAILFATFVVLVVLLIGSERNRNTLLAEYEADRAASALFESFRESSFDRQGSTQNQSSNAPASLPSNVEGFGVYSGDGEPLRVMGSAPNAIGNLISRVEPRLFRFDRRAGTIELVRMLGALPGEPGRSMRFRNPQSGRMLGMMGGQFGPPAGRQFPSERGFPAYVYVKLSTRAFFANRSLLTLSLILVPIALGVAMAVVWLLYLRNRRYRGKIESQQHLVHLGEIARTLSHEIKNPLSSIRLQTGIMRRVLDGETSRELTLIEEETDRLTHLVERIGEFLRDPTGNPQTIEIGSFLRDLVGRFDWNVEQVELPEEEVYVLFDRGRLRTVLENILKNAAESGGEGTPFSIQLLISKQRAELRVIDRGPGIPDEIREKIYDPFYTTKVKGSGIGLAISKRFVESLGGTLSLQTGKEGGTEARISLKRVSPESDTQAGGEA